MNRSLRDLRASCPRTRTTASRCLTLFSGGQLAVLGAIEGLELVDELLLGPRADSGIRIRRDVGGANDAAARQFHLEPAGKLTAGERLALIIDWGVALCAHR